jgi:hypothetical protein
MTLFDRATLRRALPLAGLAAWLASPAAFAATTPSRAAAVEVTNRIDAKDCAGAVEAMKSGLKREYPDVALLAGSMYEHGVCVKPDWDHAVLFYTQAYGAGLTEAADRLAAGFAAPEHGADVAAALWWVSHGGMHVEKGGQVLAPCAVAPEAAADVDRFVAELKTWQPERVAMCNYVAGVMATLMGEVRYPDLAQAYGVGGEITVRFLPAVPRIELKKGASREYQLLGGVFNGDLLRDREARAGGSFEKAIGAVAQRALGRYPKPSGIPAEAVFVLHYVFEVQ